MVTKAEYEAVQRHAAEALLRAEEAVALNAETNRMVKEIHDALFKAHPGYDKGLYDRMATVTIAAENGKAAGDSLIRWAKILGFFGSLSAGATYLVVHFGQSPR